MNTTLKTVLGALAISALLSGPAVANVSTDSIQSQVRSAISSSTINVQVDNGVAVLFGSVENHEAELEVKRVALSFADVDSIVNLMTVLR